MLAGCDFYVRYLFLRSTHSAITSTTTTATTNSATAVNTTPKTMSPNMSFASTSYSFTLSVLRSAGTSNRS